MAGQYGNREIETEEHLLVRLCVSCPCLLNFSLGLPQDMKAKGIPKGVFISLESDKNKMTLHRITSRYFCAGIVSESGIVRLAAPILAYMMGWTVDRVANYSRRKGWAMESIT